MNLSQNQIRELPTLYELVKNLKKEEDREMHEMGCWKNYKDDFGAIIPLDDYKNPNNDFYNYADDDSYPKGSNGFKAKSKESFISVPRPESML